MDYLLVPAQNAALVFGLRWVVLDTVLSKHSQVTRWRTDGAQMCVVYKQSGEEVYGLLSDPLPAEGKNRASANRKFLSAGACVASLPALSGETVLVIIEVKASDGKVNAVAMVGLERGVVVLDRLADPVEVDALRLAFAQKVKKSVDAIKVYGTVAHSQYAVDQKLELQALVPTGFVSSYMHPGRIRTLRSPRGALIVTSLSGLALIAWSAQAIFVHYEKSANEALQSRMAALNTPQSAHLQHVQRILEAPVVPLAAAIEAVRNGTTDMPLVHAGWELQKLSCAVSGICTVRFKRMAAVGATVANFKEEAPIAWLGITTAGQDEITFNLQLTFPVEKLDRQTWPTAAGFRDQCFTLWQYLAPGGWKAVLDASTHHSMPPGLSASQTAELMASAQAIQAMPITISAQPWWYATADADSPVSAVALGKHTVMTGDIELVSTDKAITFSAKGLSYVQK